MATKEELQDQLNRMQEKLYEAGLEQRPTMMNDIITREKETLKTIKYIIADCEKITGRPFPWIYAPRTLPIHGTCNTCPKG